MKTESLPYDKGLGNGAIYARIPQGDAFWDFSALAWIVTESDNCRVFLTETPTTSATLSMYGAQFDLPSGFGPWPLEIVLLSTGDVIGNDLVWPSQDAPAPPVPAPSGGQAFPQVQDLLTAVFRKLQVATKGVSLDPDEMANALQDLNVMLDEWSGDSLMCMGSVMVAFPLSGGKGSYTIGIGGDFNTARPNAVTDAFVRDAAGVDYRVDIISLDQFNGYEDKSITSGVPFSLYYASGGAQQNMGTIQLYPPPDTGYTLFLGEQQALTEFGSITDVVSFLPVYYAALMWNLVERLYPEYPVMDAKSFAIVQKLARESVRRLETLNFKRITVADTGLPADSKFNIMSGGFD